MARRSNFTTFFLACALSTAGFAQTPPTDGLVGHWSLDDGTGATATDSSSSGYDGSLVGGPTWTIGMLNGGLQFDGVDDQIGFGSTPLLATPAKLTISAWIKCDPEDRWRSIVDNRDSATDGYDLYLDRSGRVFFRVNGESVLGFASVDDGEWHHVVGTYIRDDLRIYVDGLRDSQPHFVPTQTIDVGATMRFGQGFNSAASAFNGSMDEIRIYDRGLAPAEIADIFVHDGGVNAPADITPDAHWTFDDSADLGADSSTNGFHATVFGSPTWLANGQINGALTFGGADSASAAAGPPIASPSTVSISAWIRHSPTGLWHSIIDKRDSTADGYDLYINPQGKLFARVNQMVVASEITVADGAWHHVAMVYNGSDLKLFVDANQDKRVMTGPLSIDTNAAVMLGENFSSGFFYQGTMDDARIFARALRQREILRLYQLGIY